MRVTVKQHREVRDEKNRCHNDEYLLSYLLPGQAIPHECWYLRMNWGTVYCLSNPFLNSAAVRVINGPRVLSVGQVFEGI